VAKREGNGILTLTIISSVSNQPQVAAVPVRKDLEKKERKEVPLVDQDN